MSIFKFPKRELSDYHYNEKGHLIGPSPIGADHRFHFANLSASYCALRRSARDRAYAVGSLVSKLRFPVAQLAAAVNYASAIVGDFNPRPSRSISVRGAVLRLSTVHWWRRHLDRLLAQNDDQAARLRGWVSHRYQIFCADQTVNRRREQRSRNRSLLAAMSAVSDSGDSFTLEELASKSVSNPALRRGEMMTRAAGLELLARDRADVALFVTLTCPSRFHVRKSSDLQPNPFYDGASPSVANKYLSSVWARCRASFARSGLIIYGIRVAEPHHDGTPHWHILLYCSPAARDRVGEILRAHALFDSPNEPGAQDHRCKLLDIDLNSGRATAYLAKYVAKNIDGAYLNSHDESPGVVSPGMVNAERVDAWASCWRIRQFQFIGCAPVTIWRELRRVSDPVHPSIEPARIAADAGSWHDFMLAVLPPGTPRKQATLSILYNDAFDISTGELALDRYGDPAAARPVGVLSAFASLRTRVKKWFLMLRSSAFSAPWCSVNNCTAPNMTPDVTTGADHATFVKTYATAGGFSCLV